MFSENLIEATDPNSWEREWMWSTSAFYPELNSPHLMERGFPATSYTIPGMEFSALPKTPFV